MGIKKYIESPEVMWGHFLAYKSQVKKNPIIVKDWVGKDAIDVYREKQADDDVELTEFDDEIEAWIIAEFKKVGLETAKSVLDKDTEALVNMTDLEEETIEEVKRILKAEFED